MEQKFRKAIRIAIYGAALLQPQTQCINFDSPSYRKFSHLTLRKADIGYSMSALFGGERDYDLIEAVEDGHVIDDTLQVILSNLYPPEIDRK